MRLLTFPEGTRNRASKGLLPFKMGPFNVAQQSQACCFQFCIFSFSLLIAAFWSSLGQHIFKGYSLHLHICIYCFPLSSYPTYFSPPPAHPRIIIVPTSSLIFGALLLLSLAPCVATLANFFHRNLFYFTLNCKDLTYDCLPCECLFENSPFHTCT